MMMDVHSAQTVLSKWPTPVVISGVEAGLSMLFPGFAVEHDFSYIQDHPIAEAYRWFCVENKALGLPMKCPHNHPTFDMTAVLYAIRPDRNYFSLSAPGTVTVLAGGASRFDESPAGSHRYLMLTEEQQARTLEAMVMLTTQPPRRTASSSAQK